MIRMFKPGEKVRKRSGGPVMQVIRYINKNTLEPGTCHVECSWYDKEDRKFRKKVFHQYSLEKLRFGSFNNVKPKLLDHGRTGNKSVGIST